ncbi:MAG: PEP-CTERM sorting domain-containing protein, partial [Verrucomicrobia bacterium]|nr:PEP-CTERM sorting domain-containing protein [Verrucomicrobiota bacterium]
GSTTIGMGYGRIDDNNTANGSFWTQIVSGSVTGNYWTIETSGSTLTLDVLARNGGDRGAITGVIIEQIPEPATLGMVALFGGGLLFIRRKLSM